ncbi:hypothetical protein B0H17DRAFT_1142313 [Mycena rosella]|uniref:Uncharacterized protein n=1 Tax=Mycena rosella TaxID=1033263 RepID=A0AAD7CXZ2_MYCRO|nr:hypothetical protein B0H17DRAFT_1142313 [Mycena rosella]
MITISTRNGDRYGYGYKYAGKGADEGADEPRWTWGAYTVQRDVLYPITELIELSACIRLTLYSLCIQAEVAHENARHKAQLFEGSNDIPTAKFESTESWEVQDDYQSRWCGVDACNCREDTVDLHAQEGPFDSGAGHHLGLSNLLGARDGIPAPTIRVHKTKARTWLHRKFESTKPTPVVEAHYESRWHAANPAIEHPFIDAGGRRSTRGRDKESGFATLLSQRANYSGAVNSRAQNQVSVKAIRSPAGGRYTPAFNEHREDPFDSGVGHTAAIYGLFE